MSGDESHAPPWKRQRLGVPVLTNAEQRVVLIQYNKDNNPEDADAVLAEYLKFVYVKIGEPTTGYFAPSEMIDAMWHAHILSTKEYFDFCDRHNGGRYIHHDPTMLRGQYRYDLTLRRYKQLFGSDPMDESIWPQRIGESIVHTIESINQKRPSIGDDTKKTTKEEKSSANVKVEDEGNVKQEEDQDNGMKAETDDEEASSAVEEETALSAEAHRRNQQAAALLEVEEGLLAAEAHKQDQQAEDTLSDQKKSSNEKEEGESAMNVETDDETGKDGNKKTPTAKKKISNASHERIWNTDDEESSVEEESDAEEEEDSDASHDSWYWDDKGNTNEARARWHRNYALNKNEKKEGIGPKYGDPRSFTGCIDGHKWRDEEYDVHCEYMYCRMSSESIDSFICG